jgi:hypothetical protein
MISYLTRAWVYEVEGVLVGVWLPTVTGGPPGAAVAPGEVNAFGWVSRNDLNPLCCGSDSAGMH